MVYNIKLFIKTACLSLFRSKGTPARLTLRRIVFLVSFYLVWPLYGIFIQLCFLLDDIFFPRNKEQPLEKPLFIVGPYRTGSTFLQRTLARDQHNFTCVHAWEIFLAPSIIQRRLVKVLEAVDRFFGGHLKRWFVALDQRSLGSVPMHKNSLFTPEEDENLLFHIWSTFHIWFMFPFPDDLPPYYAFESEIPKKHKRQVMRFFRRCVQRHVYAHGGTRIYLSKSPAFSAKIDSLKEFFPDANFVYLVRNPLNVLPSTVSWWRVLWCIFGNPPMNYPFGREIFTYIQHWFKDGLTRIRKLDPQRWMVLNYEDLVANPAKAIAGIYNKFGYEMDDSFKEILLHTKRREQNYTSRHKYNYEEMGFTREEIITGFREIFDEFGFDTGA